MFEPEQAASSVLKSQEPGIREQIVFTVKEFCAAYRISRAQFYKYPHLMPRSYYLNKRRYITAESAREWVQKLEQQHSIPTDGENNA